MPPCSCAVPLLDRAARLAAVRSGLAPPPGPTRAPATSPLAPHRPTTLPSAVRSLQPKDIVAKMRVVGLTLAHVKRWVAGWVGGGTGTGPGSAPLATTLPVPLFRSCPAWPC